MNHLWRVARTVARNYLHSADVEDCTNMARARCGFMRQAFEGPATTLAPPFPAEERCHSMLKAADGGRTTFGRTSWRAYTNIVTLVP